jgi:hypothetical protein
MTHRKRIYDSILSEHLGRYRQMAFVTGPRQVGKTTTCRGLAGTYLDWDDNDDRESILRGPAAIALRIGLDLPHQAIPVAVFDELHKYARWKRFLKGFHDTYGGRCRVLVTGSSRLDIYRRGGDSLMGRYFLFRMHPFTVAEVTAQDLPDSTALVRAPSRIAEDEFRALWEHGGFPEPFLTREARFTRRWSAFRRQQLLREDIRDLTHVRELSQIDTLATILQERSSEQIVLTSLAKAVQVSVDTLRRWMDTLCGFHLGFLVRPWFRNVAKAIRKEPKWFLRDWSAIADEGKRAETFVACHLLKAVEGWTDLGLGEFQLAYVRDKTKREVDFLIVRDRKPWVLVEVKKSDEQVSPALEVFQGQTGAPYAFQVVLDADYVETDCFARPRRPLVVPARTFLSQLL